VSNSASACSDRRSEATRRLNHVIDELGELLFDQFIWKHSEQIALANLDVRAEPFYVSWVGQNYYRRAAAAVRAMVDADARSDSLVTALTYIADNTAQIVAGPFVPELLDATGYHFDPAKIHQDIQELCTAAQAVRQYVNQYLAHLDRNPLATVPAVSEIDAMVKQLAETAHRYYLALTTTDVEIEPKVLFDWTGALRHAWIKPEQ
jgi:hypothetical protein